MLMAGAGDDQLDGGRDDDVLAGGEGRDVFLFIGRGWGRDRIAAFVSGEDVIDLGGTGANFTGLDTDGDGRVGAGDRGVALEDGLVLQLQGGVVEVAGVTSLGQADLLLLG
jgi:Ca2+-binding RTX toxin-like protein